MTRLGFLMDSGACIGCHACTVACKSEHDVPLGVNRTWVNYVETGEFPHTQRHFAVMRCNHCDDAPCISICPTGALFRASNGVVDFDDSRCIGCKGCMNACPYDALYISPDTGTAHKCNFCQHRLEVGLEPSCVSVCPTRAITVVDHDDPADPTAERIRREDLPVRAPERRTLPKVHYAGTVPEALDPLARPVAEDGLIWSDWTGSATWPSQHRARHRARQHGRRTRCLTLSRGGPRSPATW
ncbi:4Fe-4S dicluster domain-containing protein [Candidatus Poriferisodalis sp.]|uniref:4Fe-4S dicluster domain-containing protein n=1 Tax=Candidatus Poriferisodalis sp. TaxID=3101277 RepID=UPI003B5CC465